MTSMTTSPLAIPGLGTPETALDPTQYHNLGRRGTQIPQADRLNPGASSGFDPSKPMPVHVDPDEPDGFVLDSTWLRPEDTVAAMATTGDSLAAMRQLSQVAHDRQHPKLAAVQVAPSPVITDILPAIPSAVINPPPPTVPTMPELDYAKLAAAIVAAQQPARLPDPLPPLPPAASTVRLAPTADTVRRAPEVDLAASPTWNLDIPFIVGPEAQKPQFDVVFQMPDVGTAVGKYHAVLETALLVILLYDTRFEYGFQYYPPAGSAKPMQMQCSKMNKTFLVVNGGLQYSVGCIDHLVLLKVEQDA